MRQMPVASTARCPIWKVQRASCPPDWSPRKPRIASRARVAKLALDRPGGRVDDGGALTTTGSDVMADREDAVLLVQLAQWGTSMGLQAALNTIFADDFDPESASARDEPVDTVLTFGETVGTLTKN